MPRRPSAVFLAVLLGAPFAGWGAAASARQDAAGVKEPPPDLRAIAQSLKASVVRVEYTLQFDKGEAPAASATGVGAGDVTRGIAGHEAAACIDQERPAEVAGFVLSPTRIVSMDPLLHPRFIRSIGVRLGDRVVPAKPVAYALKQNAVFLELTEPLPGCAPLEFDASKPGPYYVVNYAETDPLWAVYVKGLDADLTSSDDGRWGTFDRAESLIVDRAGVPVGMTISGVVPGDGSWKGAPDDWASLAAGDLAGTLERFAGGGFSSLVRVSLGFRSPKKDEAAFNPYQARYNEPESATQWNGVGVLLPGDRVLVLHSMKPAVTARLERIRVYPAQGQPVEAAFEASLADYGAIVARLASPLGSPAALAGADPLAYRHRLLLAAEVSVRGEQRVVYGRHTWLGSFSRGWRGQVVPYLPDAGPGTFLFDPEGALAVVPMIRRRKVTTEAEWGGEQEQAVPAKYVAEALAGLPSSADPGNVPLSEADENRLAWLGVELQALDEELARASGVSDRTNDGQTGAIVTFVYAGSPAEKAGLKEGDILLAVHAEGQPRPLFVEADGGMFGDMAFPWDRLDEIPEEYFDQIPTPWPAVESGFIRSLTDLGAGTRFTIDVYRDTRLDAVAMEVVMGPSHYGSAPRQKLDALGVTVRDFTYEVRRYYQQAADEPGVIISKIEPGEKAAVAGIRPFELITHVNDEPVRSAAQFGELIKGQAEVRLSVKRMTTGRIVKILLDGGAEEPRP